MIYYRVALQADQSNPWRWKSTVLTSLNALFGFLKLYSMYPGILSVFSILHQLNVWM
jgi:hypothetical protein